MSDAPSPKPPAKITSSMRVMRYACLSEMASLMSVEMSPRPVTLAKSASSSSFESSNTPAFVSVAYESSA